MDQELVLLLRWKKNQQFFPYMSILARNHFDFCVSEKYMECLLVDFSDYNWWSISWGNPIISDGRLWNFNQFPSLQTMEEVV